MKPPATSICAAWAIASALAGALAAAPLDALAAELTGALVAAASDFVGSAREIVLRSVHDRGSAELVAATEQAWRETFTGEAIAREIEAQVRARVTVADAEAIAAWTASPVAARLREARAAAGAPPARSVDATALAGSEREIWQLVPQLLAACSAAEASLDVARAVNAGSVLAALRILGLPESYVAAQRPMIEKAVGAELATDRDALRARVVETLFWSARRADPLDFIAQIEFYESAAGRAQCRAQTESLAAALVALLETLPARVARPAPAG